MPRKIISVILTIALCLTNIGICISADNGEGSNIKYTYIKLPLDGITSTTNKVELEFSTLSNIVGNVSVYMVGDDWDKNTITLQNAPVFKDSDLVQTVSVTGAGKYNVDITSKVKALGTGYATFVFYSNDGIEVTLSDNAITEKIINFDDKNSITAPTLDANRTNNFAHSNVYTYYADGSQAPNVSLSATNDHTTGSGKSVRVATVITSFNGSKYTSGRIKFFNIFKDSALTDDDIGRTFNISFWVKTEKTNTTESPQTTDLSVGIMSVANTADMTSKNSNNYGTVYYNSGTDLSYSYTITPGEWTQCQFQYKLDNINTNSIYQVGMLAIRLPGGTTTLGDIAYIDDITVTEITGAPKLKIAQGASGASSIPTYNLPLAEAAFDGMDALEVGAVSDSNKIIVSGDLRQYTTGSSVEVYAIKSGYTAGEYNNGEAVITHKTAYLSGGFYNCELNLSSLEEYSNNITIVVVYSDGNYISKSYVYINPTFKSDIISKIAAAASADEIKSYIEGGSNPSNAEILGLESIDLFTSADTNDLEYLYDYIFDFKTEITSSAALTNLIIKGLVLNGIINCKVTYENILGAFESYKDLFELTGFAPYEKTFHGLSDDLKYGVFDSLYGNLYIDYNDFKKNFADNIIKTAITNSADDLGIIGVLNDNIDYLQLTSWTKYTSLESAYKDNVTKEIAEFVKTVYDLSTINDNISIIINKVIAEVINQDKQIIYCKIPLDQTFASAVKVELQFHADTTSGGNVDLYLLTDDWDEASINLKNAPQYTASDFIKSMAITSSGNYSVDVTDLVRNLTVSEATFVFVAKGGIEIALSDKALSSNKLDFEHVAFSSHTNDTSPQNVAYSNAYVCYRDGTQALAVELSVDYDHTTGSGKSVRAATTNPSWTGNVYTDGRVKFYNTITTSGLTNDDIGRTLNVSFWAYSEYETTISAGIMALKNTSTMNAANKNQFGTTYYNSGTKFTLPASTWTQCKFDYTLDENNVDPVYQVGMLTIGLPKGTVEKGDVVYIDDIDVTDHTNVPKLKVIKATSGEGAIPVYAIPSAEKNLGGLKVIGVEESTINKLKVSGDLREYKYPANVDLYIIKSGYSTDDYTNPRAVFAHQKVPVINGFYDCEFDMTSLTQYYNNFTITLVGIDEIGDFGLNYYYEYIPIKIGILNQLATAANVTNIKNLLEQNIGNSSELILELNNIDLYKKLNKTGLAFLYNYLYNNKAKIMDSQNQDDLTLLHKAVIDACVFNGFKNNTINTADMISIIDSYFIELELNDCVSYTKTFKNSSAETKNAIINLLYKNEYKNIDDFITAFSKSTVRIVINDSSSFSYNQVIDVLADNAEYIGLTNWSLYENVSSKYKSEVAKKIAELAKKSSDYTDLNNQIPEVISSVKSDIDKSSSSAGSSSGGGGKVTKSLTTSGETDITDNNNDKTPSFTEFEY